MSLEPTSEKENERPQSQNTAPGSTGIHSEHVEISKQRGQDALHRGHPVPLLLPKPTSLGEEKSHVSMRCGIKIAQKPSTISHVRNHIAVEQANEMDIQMGDGQEPMSWIEYLLDFDIWNTVGLPPVSDTRITDIYFPPFHTHPAPLEPASGSDIFPSLIWAPDTCPKSIDVTAVDVEPRAEEGWPLANCNSRPLSSSTVRSDEAWQNMGQLMSANHDAVHHQLHIVPLSVNTRDRILATAQSLLQKALYTQTFGLNGPSPTASGMSSPRSDSFSALPPSNILEIMLHSYANSVEPYYDITHGSVIDPNEMLLENQSSTLTLLLMIAQGANSVSMPEALHLTAGLMEACPILLFDLIENNMDTSVDLGMLKSALQFTTLAAGEILRYLGMLEPQHLSPLSLDSTCNPDLQWKQWVKSDTVSRQTMPSYFDDFNSVNTIRSCDYLYSLKYAPNEFRLVYNWVMVDQELSLFHDTSPMLAITALETPISGGKNLWLAKSAAEWLELMQETRNSAMESPLPPTFSFGGRSLKSLFQNLLLNDLCGRNYQPSAAELRLLLHPIQSLLCQVGQVIGCTSERRGSHRTARPLTAASTLLRLEEAESALQRWYDLCMITARKDSECPFTTPSIILYHVICLNTITYFPEIERLARKESFLDSPCRGTNQHYRCIQDSKKAIIHSGQILRLIASMKYSTLPPWWPIAVYRAAMVLWTDSILRIGVERPARPNGGVLKINATPLEDASISEYIWHGYGDPVLVDAGGENVTLQLPERILCVYGSVGRRKIIELG
ncbi:hypothetical protein BDZ45DRAFT_747032 [Acephala macrosclerotiorum]|nr:hypothetical protein BDZ45DRAFT_747032 [Acephala macrosclerotiorum]